LIYLFDDNLIADSGEITNQDPYRPEQMALAMSNALFKVFQPNGCLLFGQLNETFAKVSEGSLFLSFGLLAYIPTLPDPYAANLGLIRNQFGRHALGLPGGPGTNMQGWLVGRTAWTAEEEGDGIEVSFHSHLWTNFLAEYLWINLRKVPARGMDLPGLIVFLQLLILLLIRFLQFPCRIAPETGLMRCVFPVILGIQQNQNQPNFPDFPLSQPVLQLPVYLITMANGKRKPTVMEEMPLPFWM
jgi:hypothetical protein